MRKLLSIFVFSASLLHSALLCAQENKDSADIIQVDRAYSDSQGDEDINIFIEAPEPGRAKGLTDITDSDDFISDSANIDMPNCDNLQLHQLVQDKIANYFKKEHATSIVEKRRQILLLRHLNKFESIDPAEITPQDNRLLADKIITYKINKGLEEENMRICRSLAYHPIYLFMYPEQDAFRVEIVNFPGQADSEKFSIVYN